MWNGKINKKRCSVIKNQGFAESSQIRCEGRVCIDFRVTLWIDLEPRIVFLREKMGSKTALKSRVDIHRFVRRI